MIILNVFIVVVYWFVQGLLWEYLMFGWLVEVVYWDSVGQIQMVYDFICDLFSWVGYDYIFFGWGFMISLDYVIILDGWVFVVNYQ